MSESTGKGHQVPDSTSLSIRLATEYNEPTVPGTTKIVPSTKELTETTTAPGGLVQHTMASQKQSVCGSLLSQAESGDVPQPLYDAKCKCNKCTRAFIIDFHADSGTMNTRQK